MNGSKYVRNLDVISLARTPQTLVKIIKLAHIEDIHLAIWFGLMAYQHSWVI